MRLDRGKIRLIALAVVGGLLLMGTGAAIATHVASHWATSGGASKQVKIVGSTAATETGDTAWTKLPASTVFFQIAAEQTDLILARFTAESECTGDQAGDWCGVRIVVKNNQTLAVTELNPQSGNDFAFDAVSATTDNWESNAIERSGRFGGGTYAAWVEYRVDELSSTATFRLDDWHFALERIE